MENQIQIFSNPKFGTIRTILIDDVPYFVGKDVATALGYADTDKAIRIHVNEEDKRFLNPADLAGLRPDATFQINSPYGLIVINESGLYRLIFSSKLPKAVEFTHWVTNEVLPSIRHYGYYVAPNATFDIDLILKLIPEINLTEDQINLLKTATPMLAAQTSAMITRILKKYEKNTDVTALVALDLPGEIWKWLKGYESYYQGSTFGRVRSFFNGECNILIPTLGPKGYYTVCLYKDDKNETGKNRKSKKTFRLNRLIAETFIPNPLNLPEVHHKDHNKANNRADNLEWVTGEQNKEYAKEGDRYLKGEDNPFAKLTEEKVRFIREYYKAGDPEFGNIALADRFKVSDVTITNIVTFKSWRHVK